MEEGLQYFAMLSEENEVKGVLSIENKNCMDSEGLMQEEIGIQYLNRIAGEVPWKMSSTGISSEDDLGLEFRGNRAGIGMLYLENVCTMGVGSTDIFIGKQPYPSWSISPERAKWVSPHGDPPTHLYESNYAVAQMNGNKIFYDFHWDEEAYQKDNDYGWKVAIEDRTKSQVEWKHLPAASWKGKENSS